MELIVAKDYEELSQIGADLLAAAIEANPTAAVVLPTGDTPMGVYRELVARGERGDLDASQLRLFLLDEYLGIGVDDPRSLCGWLQSTLLDPLGIPTANMVTLPGDAADPEAACRIYDRAVADAGGFDLSVLGLGPNGHLGFNEPPAGPDEPTRVVTLAEESIESNAQYWGGPDLVPRQAMTAGMRQLLGAARTLLLVSGVHKRDILRRTIQGPVTPEVPASYLQQISGVTVIADREAWPYGQ